MARCAVCKAQRELLELIRRLEAVARRQEGPFLDRCRSMTRGAGSLLLGQLASRLQLERHRAGGRGTETLERIRAEYRREEEAVLARLERRSREVRERLQLAEEILREVVDEGDRVRLLRSLVDSPALARAHIHHLRTMGLVEGIAGRAGDPPPAVPGEEFCEEMRRLRVELVGRWRELKTWATGDPENDRTWAGVRSRLSRLRTPLPDCRRKPRR